MSNQMKEIDWSKAPECAIGAFTRGNETFFVKTKQPSEYMNQPGFQGVQCDGKEYHVFTEFWAWSERPAPWSGEGLPPVGEIIEWLDGKFLKAVVVGHHQGAVVAVDDDDPRRVFIGKKPCYRPFRTPEQIAAEERRAAILEMKGHLSFSDYREAEQHCAALYDAGYRKVTP